MKKIHDTVFEKLRTKAPRCITWDLWWTKLQWCTASWGVRQARPASMLSEP